MARTESNMMPLGTSAPNFELLDAAHNRIYSLNDLTLEKGLLIVFGCNHCPFVKHILPQLNELVKKYMYKGISAFMINSNDTEAYPEDSFENMAKLVEEKELVFPYLFDKDQSVAKAYDATCTPDIFLFDGDLKLVYRGQFDDSRPDKGVATGKDLETAIKALINDEPITIEQKPSLGCNIKWKK